MLFAASYPEAPTNGCFRSCARVSIFEYSAAVCGPLGHRWTQLPV